MPEFVTLGPSVVLRIIKGEGLLLKLDAEDVFALNASGTRIVQLLLEGRDLDAVVSALEEGYSAERSELQRDVTNLVEQLRSRGLVRVSAEGRLGE
jgi:hypothetical protein